MATDFTNRNAVLAKIHIAKKELALDDDAYRDIIKLVGGAESGSSADLGEKAANTVIRHFVHLGWKPKQLKNRKKNAAHASESQIKLIRDNWIRMYEAGIVKSNDEKALDLWVKSASRTYHPQRFGYGALHFLPAWVAQKIIEIQKQWAKRRGLDLGDREK